MKYTFQNRGNRLPPAKLSGAGTMLGKAEPKDVLQICIDTREQTPLEFPGEYCQASRGTVNVFDYALANDLGWACERKSLADFVQATALSVSWKRELAKIEKARAWLLPIVLVCEFHYSDISTYDFSVFKSGSITPQFIRRRIAELIYNHGVAVMFMGNRETAAYFICTLLKRRKESLRANQLRQAE